ncbi:response regulator transcription factor [Pseudorhodoferax sp. Leaf267]|uniref:response regulator n=1 Tax=Pseudorhodoferax sp. Leaf267 TaxID=1736316 RepID=UPI0006F2BFBC|nr:response regulator transcription factor [Pseudorhodoferax sp. Leaf267]KQP21785.1 LuxR family transcriptional regulator [Pseudorhodoferax sp. Leaf267]
MHDAPVTVALVEDDPEVRERLVQAIGANAQLRLLQACGTACAMQRWLDANPVDVLLVDLGLPDRPGLDVIRHARGVQPQCSVMVVSTFADAAHMVQAFEAGACGYLVKDGTQDELARHVMDLHAGGSPMSPIIARQLLARWQAHAPKPARPRANVAADTVSPREMDVLRLVARGCNYQETGACLGIATATVQAHVRNLYGKLDVHSKTEAVYEARQLGLLDWA